MGRNNDLDSGYTRPKNFGQLIGTSTIVQRLYQDIIDWSGSNDPIVFTGAIGSGKTKAAEMLHFYSNKKNEPFFIIDCKKSEQEILKSLLPETSATILIKQSEEILTSDVEEIFLTLNNKQNHLRLCLSLQEETNISDFKKNYIRLPCLKYRHEDVIDLAYVFLENYKNKHSSFVEDFSQETLQVFRQYDWPENIKELKQLIENLVFQSCETIISPVSLPANLRKHCFNSSNFDQKNWQPLRLPLWQIEKRAIEQAIQLCRGNIPKAAEMLDISPSTIYRKIRCWKK